MENAEYGIAGGIVTTILTILGFKSRMDKLERNAMYKDICEAKHDPIDESLKRIEGKLDNLLSRRRQDNDDPR